MPPETAGLVRILLALIPRVHLTLSVRDLSAIKSFFSQRSRSFRSFTAQASACTRNERAARLRFSPQYIILCRKPQFNEPP